MINVLYILLLTLISCGLGKRLLGKHVQGLSPAEGSVFSIGLGLGALAFIMLALGVAGLLHFSLVISLLLILCVCFYRDIGEFVRELISGVRRVDHKKISLFEKILLIILFSAFFFSLIGALAPPTGNDALAYHLQHPRIFLENHTIAHIPYTRESLWPYLTEMLFTLGMLLRGPVLAKLFHYLFGLLSTLAVFCLARRCAGKKTGILASVLFYLSPGIFMQASYAYVDLVLCFYVFCSVYLFFLWAADKKNGTLVFSGIFMGLALSVKVLAGMALIPMLILLLWELSRGRQRSGEKRSSFLMFLMPAVLPSSVWYARSFLVTGNPVYPFMHNIFSGGWESNLGADMGHIKGFIGFLRLPWDLVMHAKDFGGEQIGFLFLSLLPCLVFVDWKNKINRRMGVFILLYTVIWFAVDPNIRFLFPVFPIIFLLIACGLNKLISRGFVFLRAVVIAGLLFNLALAFYYNVPAVKLLSGNISEEEYLSQNERTYNTAEWVNDNLGNDSLLIVAGEPRLLYFKAQTLEYTIVNRVCEGDEGRIDAVFRQEMVPYKNVYILISGYKPDQYINNRIKKKEPVFTTSFTEDGRHIHYSIFRLK